MKVSYRGIEEKLSPKLQEKLDAKFGKLSKLLEKRGEKEAHVMVTKERHQINAEITLQFYDHQLVGLGSNGDLFTAMSGALEKLEKQAVKTRGKWREKARRQDKEPLALAAVQTPAAVNGKAAVKVPKNRVNRVQHLNRSKPMTLDEAVMQMEDGREYVVYQDSDRECLSVLVRTRNGNFDLIESQ
jgi:putative sigma-54 modulation protein